MKVVINRRYGGFGLSSKAEDLYKLRKGINEETDPKGYFYDGDIDRNDPLLVQIVEELEAEADGEFASLKVIEIPDDIEWYVEEYDGMEWVAEAHRTWS